MMVLNTFAGFVTMQQIRSHILINIREQYMKESNTLAVNANIKQLQGIILKNTIGEYMKESNTLADCAANISLRGEV